MLVLFTVREKGKPGNIPGTPARESHLPFPCTVLMTLDEQPQARPHIMGELSFGQQTRIRTPLRLRMV